MGKSSTMVIIVVVINIFLIFGNYDFKWGVTDNSILNMFVATPNTTQPANLANSSGSVMGQFPKSKELLLPNTNTFGLLDGLNLIWNVIQLLFQLIFGICYFFYTIPSFPTVIATIISVPISIIYILSLINVIRGSEPL